jgi:hypothetical protein
VLIKPVQAFAIGGVEFQIHRRAAGRDTGFDVLE